MDLPVIGAHCYLPSCNELDLLPIKCYCERMFCRKHIVPDSHECTSASAHTTGIHHLGPPAERCFFADCGKKTLGLYGSGVTEKSPTKCTGCSFSFCVVHRFPSAHLCPNTMESKSIDHNNAARELLAKNFPTSTSGPSPAKARPATTKNPLKLASIRNVELLKMRQNARPGDPKKNMSSISDRHYVLVKCNESDSFSPFWFIKSVSMGRAFDLLHDRFGLKGAAGTSDLFKLSADEMEREQVTTFDKVISEVLENGCKLLLVASGPQH